MSETPIAKITLPNEIFFADVAALVKQGRAVTISAKGASMYPFIRPSRDRVVLSAPASVSVGDIVLALLDGSNYVLHRVESIDGESVCLMGDGNIRNGERCEMKDILAKVTHIVRNGRPVSTASTFERTTARLWCMLQPVRRYLLFAIRCFDRVRGINESDI
jgi:SOS-response transcriptional repressor LexA